MMDLRILNLMTYEYTIEFNSAVTSDIEDYISITAKDVFDVFKLDPVEYTLDLDVNYLVITIENFEYSADYKITIKSGLEFEDGVLGEDVIYTFQTKIKPLYTTVRTIRSYIGDFISDVDDDTIKYFIYKRSLEVSRRFRIRDRVPKPAIDYVVCAVQLDILRRKLIENGLVSNKRLDTFSVSYSSKYPDGIRKMVDKLERCVSRNLDLLEGGPGTHVKTVVRASKDPRRPKWRRLNDEGSF